MAVPHCTDCAHSLGSTFFVPQLGGRFGDAKLYRSWRGVATWILGNSTLHTEGRLDIPSLNGEGVPPAIRVRWLAVPDSKSLAECLASTVPTRMQSVVGSVPADGSCICFPGRTKHLSGHAFSYEFWVHHSFVGGVCEQFVHVWRSNLLLHLECAGDSDTAWCRLDFPESPRARQKTRLGCSCHVPRMPRQKHSAMCWCDHQPDNKREFVFFMGTSASTSGHRSPSLREPAGQCSWHHTVVRRIQPDNNPRNT